MKLHIPHVRGRLLAAAAILLALAGISSASAQKFQYIYGCACDAEAGRRGVAPVSEGGYIAVGESFSVANAPDIYVVRTQDDGTLAWSFTYDVGDHDSATDVQEVQDSIPIVRYDTIIVNGKPVVQKVVTWKVFTDGFIITGVTRWNRDVPGDSGHVVHRTDRDLFLLRIDRCGVVRWFKTYGTDTTDEIGYDLQILTTGDGKATNPGDIIVAGSTTRKSKPGPGPRDAYLLRTDRNGNIIWDRTYDVDAAGMDDWFYGVTEALAQRPANKPADIVAVGGTTALGGPDIDALIARVDGGNGKVIAARPHSIMVYADVKDEDLRAVRELTIAPHAGELAVIGRTTSFDNGANDIFVMRTTTNPNVPLAQHIYGEIDADDEGYDLVEIKSGPSYDRGLLIMTGYVTSDEGLGGKDAYLQKLDPMTLKPHNQMHIYGGSETDWGWSLSTVGARTQNGMPCSTDGYVMCGFTESDFLQVNDPRQLYLVKTNTDLISDCNEDSIDIPEEDIAMLWQETQVRYDSIRRFFMPPIKPLCNDWFDTLCLDLDGSKPWPIAPCPACNGGGNPGDTNHHLKMRPDIAHSDENTAATLTGVPNPVRRGGTLELRTTLAAEADVEVSVVDLAGREVRRLTERHDAGTAYISLDTHGWNVGSYVVTLRGGGRTASTRIVVVDR